MAYTTINKSTDYFNTVLYTGNETNPKAITGVGHQPDFVWIKTRDTSAKPHMLFDSVRGVYKNLRSDVNNAEDTNNETLTAFGTDGFTLGNNGKTNLNSAAHVAWNWKAGTTGSGTTTGSGYGKAYSYSVNTTAGFSVITYKGNGTAGHTIPHHLGATPSLIIVKNRDAAQSWLVGMTQLGWTKNLHLNEDGAVETTTNIWNDTAPTSTVFTVGTNTKCNTNDEDYIAYVFAEKTGYSKFGSYVGNGSTGDSAPFVYTGFKPAFVIYKNSNAVYHWGMFDNKRSPFNVKDDLLFPNLSNVESTGDGRKIDMVSNGFKVRVSSDTNDINGSGNTIIYWAFAEAPLVGTNNIPATAR